MIFVGIIIGIIIIAAIAYLAIDKKSSFHTRLASLAALAVMIITIIICLIIIFSDDKVVVDPSTLIVGAPVEATEDNSIIGLIFTIIFFLALFIVIAVLAMREHRKHDKK